MGVLPALDVTLYSVRTPEDVLTILRSVTVQKKSGFIVSAGCEFTGEITGMEFRLLPNLWYNNSFQPVIKGQIETEGERSRIRLRMRMHPFTSGFCIVWCLGVAFFLLIAVLMAFFDGISACWLGITIPAVMLLFGQIMMRFGFYRPARNAVRRLTELLGAVVCDGPCDESGGAKERGGET